MRHGTVDVVKKKTKRGDSVGKRHVLGEGYCIGLPGGTSGRL